MADDDGDNVAGSSEHGYVLDEQVGYMLRKAYQRNSGIFLELIPHGLTMTQFSAMYRLGERGSMSQNQLGRSVAMDAATTKGIVNRLAERNFVRTDPDPKDRRRYQVSLTEQGKQVLGEALEKAAEVSRTTLSPLKPAERRTFLKLLSRLQ